MRNMNEQASQFTTPEKPTITSLLDQKHPLETVRPLTQPPKALKQNPWLITGVTISALIVLGIISFLTYQKSRFRKQVHETISEPSTSNRILALRTENKKILSMTEKVLEAIKSKNFTEALPYFTYGEENQSTREDILTALALIEVSYNENKSFTPRTSLENIELVDIEAQAVIDFTITGQPSSVRFDFRKINQNWKIEYIVFGGKLNLKQTKQAEKAAKKQLSDASYLSSPSTLRLPGGDIIEIEKTLISRKSDGFGFKVNNPQKGYLFVIYEPPYIRSYKEIQARESFTGSIKLDLEGLEENWGVLLVYPEGTKIVAKKNEIQVEPLIQVPFKIQSNGGSNQ